MRRQRPPRAQAAGEAQALAQLLAQCPALGGARPFAGPAVAHQAQRPDVALSVRGLAKAVLEGDQRHSVAERAPGARQGPLELTQQVLGARRGGHQRTHQPGDRRQQHESGDDQQKIQAAARLAVPGVARARVGGEIPPLRGHRRAAAVGKRLGERHRRLTAASGRDQWRRVKPDPAVGRKPHLDPGVGIDVGHDPLVPGALGARRETGGHPRGDATHSQQQRHRPGELLAVAGLLGEQEAQQRIPADGRVLVVGVAVREIALDAGHERERSGRAPCQPPGERVGGRVGRCGHVLGGVASERGLEHRRRGGGVKRREGHLRGHVCRDVDLWERERQVVVQGRYRVAAAGVGQLSARGAGRIRRDLVGRARAEGVLPDPGAGLISLFHAPGDRGRLARLARCDHVSGPHPLDRDLDLLRPPGLRRGTRRG